MSTVDDASRITKPVTIPPRVYMDVAVVLNDMLTVLDREEQAAEQAFFDSMLKDSQSALTEKLEHLKQRLALLPPPRLRLGLGKRNARESANTIASKHGNSEPFHIPVLDGGVDDEEDDSVIFICGPELKQVICDRSLVIAGPSLVYNPFSHHRAFYAGEASYGGVVRMFSIVRVVAEILTRMNQSSSLVSSTHHTSTTHNNSTTNLRPQIPSSNNSFVQDSLYIHHDHLEEITKASLSLQVPIVALLCMAHKLYYQSLSLTSSSMSTSSPPPSSSSSSTLPSAVSHSDILAHPHHQPPMLHTPHSLVESSFLASVPLSLLCSLSPTIASLESLLLSATTSASSSFLPLATSPNPSSTLPTLSSSSTSTSSTTSPSPTPPSTLLSNCRLLLDAIWRIRCFRQFEDQIPSYLVSRNRALSQSQQTTFSVNTSSSNNTTGNSDSDIVKGVREGNTNEMGSDHETGIVNPAKSWQVGTLSDTMPKGGWRTVYCELRIRSYLWGITTFPSYTTTDKDENNSGNNHINNTDANGDVNDNTNGGSYLADSATIDDEVELWQSWLGNHIQFIDVSESSYRRVIHHRQNTKENENKHDNHPLHATKSASSSSSSSSFSSPSSSPSPIVSSKLLIQAVAASPYLSMMLLDCKFYDDISSSQSSYSSHSFSLNTLPTLSSTYSSPSPLVRDGPSESTLLLIAAKCAPSLKYLRLPLTGLRVDPVSALLANQYTASSSFPSTSSSSSSGNLSAFGTLGVLQRIIPTLQITLV